MALGTYNGLDMKVSLEDFRTGNWKVLVDDLEKDEEKFDASALLSWIEND